MPPVALLSSRSRRAGGHDSTLNGMLLKPSPTAAYCLRMPETSPEKPVPAGWHERVVRNKTQIAAGRSVPLLPVSDRLRATAERLEAEQGVTADGAEGPADR